MKCSKFISVSSLVLIGISLVSCDSQTSTNVKSDQSGNYPSNSESINVESNTAFQCPHDVYGAKSALISAVNQIDADIKSYGNSSIGAAPSIPNVVELKNSIRKAEMIVADSRCTEAVQQEGLEMYIQNSKKVEEYTTIAQENRMEIIKMLSEGARLNLSDP